MPVWCTPGQPDDEERKPDLFISKQTPQSVTLHLCAGDFAVFLPRRTAPGTVRRYVTRPGEESGV